jgi:hypothetical protein
MTTLTRLPCAAVVARLFADADAVPEMAKKEGSVMTNQEAWKLYENYLGAWNTTSIEKRLKIATEVLSENIEYQTARHDLSAGRSLVIEDMATFHEKFPGGHFEIGVSRPGHCSPSPSQNRT